MSLKIRLARGGAKKRPYYRIVVADSRSPRDGRFIENIGKYHPLEDPSLIEIDEERALHWLRVGAQPSDQVRNLMVKIPATEAGLPAIEQVVSEGINVNVTLLFSVKRYRDVLSAHLEGVGYYLRQDVGFGRFITEQDIEEFRPLLITDIFRIEPSVQHLFIPGENRWAVIFRGAARMRFIPNTPCFPRLVLDGNRLDSYDMDNLVHPDDVAGIELYPSGHGAPVRYAGLGAPCGIIIIWTKRG